MEYIAYSVAVLLIIGLVVGFAVMVKIEAAHSKRTHCRCCRGKLRSKGGLLVPFLGRGFCPICAASLMKPRKQA